MSARVESRWAQKLASAESRRHAAGPMLLDILRALSDAAADDTQVAGGGFPHGLIRAPSGKPPRVTVLLGHDATLLSLLAALPGCRWDTAGGEEPSGWPPTGASIRFELWQGPRGLAPAASPSGEEAVSFIRVVWRGRPLWLPVPSKLHCSSTANPQQPLCAYELASFVSWLQSSDGALFSVPGASACRL